MTVRLLNPESLHLDDPSLTLSTDSDQAQNYQQIQDPDNQPEMTHELAAGGAAYFAAREYEKHCDENGKLPTFLLPRAPNPWDSDSLYCTSSWKVTQF